MAKPQDSKVTRVTPKRKETRPSLRRDNTLTGGERAETPEEKQIREQHKREPKEAPIIQKDPL